MSPREACQTDPAQRLALLTAYKALEMAVFVPDRTLRVREIEWAHSMAPLATTGARSTVRRTLTLSEDLRVS